MDVVLSDGDAVMDDRVPPLAMCDVLGPPILLLDLVARLAATPGDHLAQRFLREELARSLNADHCTLVVPGDAAKDFIEFVRRAWVSVHPGGPGAEG